VRYLTSFICACSSHLALISFPSAFKHNFQLNECKNALADLNVTEDVAGATVMAAASSSPELFVNVIGTFVTEGDLGVGTIVGSAVFNILAVPACCALFAHEVRARS